MAEPEVARRILRAWELIRTSMTEAELRAAIQSGGADALLNHIAEFEQRIYGALSGTIRTSTFETAQSMTRLTPHGLDITFDQLNPRVTDAVRNLNTRVITTLNEQIRDTVRQHIDRGLQDGVSPREMSVGLRQVIGLAPNQELAVVNFERALRGQSDRSPLDYRLRDRRFDRTLSRVGQLSDEQVEKMVTAYRRRFVAFNAETNAHTAAMDSVKLGQKLAWDDAIARGDVEGGQLDKEWVVVGGPAGDGRNRPEHLEMHGERVRYDQPFSNGQMVPGESDFNCRCIARYILRPAPKLELVGAN